MNVSSTSSTPPGQVGASTASSSDSSPYTDYMGNGSQRSGSTSNRVGASNPVGNQVSKSSVSASSSSATLPSLPQTTDHIQRLTQMTHDMGLMKSESDSSTSNSVITAGLSATDPLYPATAAAYIQQQYTWQNAYYQQLGQPMAPGAFPGWPQCYPPGSWQNYAQTKKGRQTYQRYQTSVLESKFQQSSYVSKKQREELRLQTNLTDRQIKIWFQESFNRRMKAKKEKNRSEDPSEHSTLLPSNNASKSLNNSLSSLNGSGQANNDGMMAGTNLSMIGNQHLLGESTLQGLMMDQDEGKQLKLAGLHNGMMSNASTTSPMWPPGMHAATAGVLNTDQINAWPQFMTQSAHQSSQYPYMSYPLCPPQI